MHGAPGLAGAVRTQKVVMWHPKNRKSEISRFWWILMPAGPPRTPPPPSPGPPSRGQRNVESRESAERRKRIPGHKAAIRQMHCAAGLAGAVRTQKMVIWQSKKNRHKANTLRRMAGRGRSDAKGGHLAAQKKKRYSDPLALHQGWIWQPGGTLT
eukprot:gene25839-biopygen19527